MYDMTVVLSERRYIDSGSERNNMPQALAFRSRATFHPLTLDAYYLLCHVIKINWIHLTLINSL